MDCMMNKLAEEVQGQKINCLPIHYLRYLKDKISLPECELSTKRHSFFDEVSALLTRDIFERFCPVPCDKKVLRVNAVPVYTTANEFDTDAILGQHFEHAIFFMHPSNEVNHLEEYVIYDSTAIVGSVGGGLGLFLGFSCLSAAKTLIDLLFRNKRTVM